MSITGYCASDQHGGCPDTKKDKQVWSTWLTKRVGRRAPSLYTLYYGVRMDVWIHAKLTTKWHGWRSTCSSQST